MYKVLQTKLNKRNKDEGFTLIELLVVIAIIGVLAAIALPIFLNQQVEAIKASVKSDVINTNQSLASYLVENPTASTSDLQAQAVSSGGDTVTVGGSGSSYTICASDPAAPNYSWGYDSTTGVYSEGCASNNGGGNNNGGGGNGGDGLVTRTGTQVFTCDFGAAPSYGILSLTVVLGDYTYQGHNFSITGVSAISGQGNLVDDAGNLCTGYTVDYTGDIPANTLAYVGPVPHISFNGVVIGYPTP